MRLEDFRIVKGDGDLQFVEYNEGPTKTRQAGLNAKPRYFPPKMFRTRGERCRCSSILFRIYKPTTFQVSTMWSILSLGELKINRRHDDETWYKVQPMGVDKINSMMKDISSLEQLLRQARRRFPITMPAKDW
jgi:hypothetical protein